MTDSRFIPETHLDRVLVDRDRIAARVDELGRQIAETYRDQDLTIMAVLTGSMIFLADLIRRIPLMMHIDVVSISSYPGRSTTTRGPRWLLPISTDLKDRNVLVIDDILDSGLTLQAMLSAVRAMEPASLRSCVLLRKERPDLETRFEPDFVGFDIPNEFVVGYGLDFDNLYRNVPEICLLSEHATGEQA
ncbi:MAG: hypoxanthine phosphoribosyltransferase [Phycisphaerae bacterium]